MIIFGVPNVPMLIEVTQVIGLIITLYVTPSLFPWCVVCMEKKPKTGASSLPEFHIASQKVPVLSRRIFSTSLWGCVSPPSLHHPLRVCLILTASLDTICPATYIYLRKPTSHTHTIFSAWSLPLKDLKPPASFPKKIHKVKLGKAVASSSDRKCI